MSTVTRSTSGALHAAMAGEGFAFVHGADMRELLAAHGVLSDWQAFADSWNRLELDTYMADGGRYRRRRHGVYRARTGETAVRGPHEPHFQAIDYNPMNGGVARWFEPIETSVGVGQSMRTVLQFSQALFGALAPATLEWRIEVHQFRIEARGSEQGRPTPEGLHRDGVDYVLVLLVNRQNIARGTTTVHDLGGRPLGAFTLTHALDAALVDDARVAHGVTSVEPITPSAPAYRDVLVVTFKNERARS